MANTETSETQARAQLESIVAMVQRLETAESCDSMSREHLAPFDGAEFHNCANCDDYTMLGMASGDGWLCHHCYCDTDAAREAIQENALSVEVRSGWLTLEQIGEHWQNVTNGKELPLTSILAEYKILLCWGGPAVRIVGELDQYGEPETARLEHQDWGTSWTEYQPMLDHAIPNAPYWEVCRDTDSLDALLTYARQFYYGS